VRKIGRSRAVKALVPLLAVVLAACTNTPPPPVVSSPVAQSSTTPDKSMSQIVVGVDDVVGGYNPHNLADSSTVTSALAQLLLPSVFREDDTGTPKLDKSLMRSADVVSRQPFTVSYEIRQDASWSDGAPISVEDFVYLWDAMRDQPGVVEPAGYRLISDIRPGEGGKRVEVTFARPYPAWPTLFSNLLPQHLLKDAPGGWQGALESSFPAYGGPFSIKTVDKDRGEIILERNERYWEKPAAVDRLILRRTDQAGMANALRGGTDQFAMARTDAGGLRQLAELGPGVQLHTVASPRTAAVLLRPATPAMANDQVRAAVAALIDRNRLIDEGVAGGPSATLRADAQVLAPSTSGYAPTIPPAAPPAKPDPQLAQNLLTLAGYQKDAGVWRKDGKPLSLVVASPGKAEPYAGMAKELADQLTAAGIEVRTVNPQPRDLYANLLALPVSRTPQQPPPDGAPGANGSAVGVDIAVTGEPTSGDPASVLASNFGCRPVQQQPTDPSAPVVPPNPAAFCDESLQPTIDAVLSGSMPLQEALSRIEPELWQRHAVIPLFQLADTLAIGPGISGVTPGPPMVGPFGSAVNWTRGTK
jgi:ABC-type transport system substrate-binding protein